MTAGKLAAAKPAAITNTTLYRCPITEAASTVLEVCNQSGSSATYRAALRDYDQILTLDSASYALQRGNVITNYKLSISPGIASDEFDPGDVIELDNNQGTFIISDIEKNNSVITYAVKVEPIGELSIDSTSLVGNFSVGDTITGATTGLTAVIYRVSTSSFQVKIPQVSASATSVYINNVSGVLANDYISTGGEIMQISSLSGYNATVTRAQIGTTAVAQTPGSNAIIFRASATTTTINEGAPFDSSDTTLTVSSAASIVVGDYLRINNEILTIQSINGNDLSVSRASLGTTAATHADGATCTVYQTTQICSFQFFNFTEEVDNGSGATVDLNVVAAGIALPFSQNSRFVYDLNGTDYEFPENISVDAERIVKFDQSDSSNTGNTLRFSLSVDGTWGGGNEFTTGVTVSGTAGSAGAYSQINLSPDNIQTNNQIYIYSEDTAQLSAGGFLNIDLTPNYTNIFIYDPSKTITTSDTFTINNVNYTVTAVDVGSYGYVSAVSGADIKVSLGLNSAAFVATDTFFDSPLEPASDRTEATVSSVSSINAEDYIYYGKTIAANTTDRTTGLVVGPGQSLMVYSSSADLSYMVQGFSDKTNDFSVINYIRRRTNTVGQ